MTQYPSPKLISTGPLRGLVDEALALVFLLFHLFHHLEAVRQGELLVVVILQVIRLHGALQIFRIPHLVRPRSRTV